MKMEEKKKEFEDTFTGGKKFAGNLNFEELWIWIEKEINYARMEQDIINNQAFLDKQDKIIQQAKIDECTFLFNRFSSDVGLCEVDDNCAECDLTRAIFNNRISELKGE